MDHKRDTEIGTMLDALGERERGLPAGDFEARIAAEARRRTPAPRRVPGRRRLLIAPAALAGIAAAIAVAVVLLPTPQMHPAVPSVAVDAELASIEEMSFSLFDDTFGLETAFAEPADGTMMIDPTSLDDWFVEGDAL